MGAIFAAHSSKKRPSGSLEGDGMFLPAWNRFVEDGTSACRVNPESSSPEIPGQLRPDSSSPPALRAACS